VIARPDPRDPVAAVERQALECLLQVPRLVPAVDADALRSDAFRVPAYGVVHDAIAAAGGMAVAVGLTGQAWVTSVQEQASEIVKPLIAELAVAPLLADREDALAKYAAGMVLRMAELGLSKRIAELHSRLQRAGESDAAALLIELSAAEPEKRALLARIHGS
jgi:DNA primase